MGAGEDPQQAMGGSLGPCRFQRTLNTSCLAGFRVSFPLSGLDPFAHGAPPPLHPCAGCLPVSVTSSSSDACGSGSWTACRHVSPVLVTIATGCKAPGHQWAVALRGAMPWVREGLLSCSCGKLGRGCCRWGLSGPSLSLPWHFLPAICAGSWGEGPSAIPGGRGLGADGWKNSPPARLGSAVPHYWFQGPFQSSGHITVILYFAKMTSSGPCPA